MEWHIQYRIGDVEHIDSYPGPEQAIDAACIILDKGWTVYGIGVGPLSNSIDRDHVEAIYALWTRGRHPFGIDHPSGTDRVVQTTLITGNLKSALR